MTVTGPRATAGLTFNPTQLPDREDPFAFYARSRAHEQIVWVAEMHAWLVTRYADCAAVLSQPELFSSTGTLMPLEALNPPEVMEILADGGRPGTPMIQVDPPEHTVMRQLGRTVFRGPLINAQLPFLRQRAHELIDAFVDDGEAELSSQFTVPFVRCALARVAGFPDTDADQIAVWTDAFLTLLGPYPSTQQRIEAARGLVDYHRYLTELLVQRARFPRDDMLSLLMSAGPDTPSMPDARMFAKGLAAGGLHTTINAINSAVHTMLTTPDAWADVRSDPSLAGPMFEETLRRDAPHRGLMRRVTRPTVLAGVTLHPGELVLPLLGSANRDETVFADPDAFRPGRPRLREHMAFGHGIHLCLGAALARAQGREAIKALTARLPGARLAEGYVPEHEPEYFFWGLRSLQLTW